MKPLIRQSSGLQLQLTKTNEKLHKVSRYCTCNSQHVACRLVATLSHAASKRSTEMRFSLQNIYFARSAFHAQKRARWRDLRVLQGSVSPGYVNEHNSLGSSGKKSAL